MNEKNIGTFVAILALSVQPAGSNNTTYLSLNDMIGKEKVAFSRVEEYDFCLSVDERKGQIRPYMDFNDGCIVDGELFMLQPVQRKSRIVTLPDEGNAQKTFDHYLVAINEKKRYLPDAREEHRHPSR